MKAAAKATGPASTPWLTLKELAAYIRRGERFTRKEIKRGRLRAAIVGGRREIAGRREWCDEYMESQATPVPFGRRHAS